MSLCAVLFVKYARKHGINSKGSDNVKVISSLRLTARDIFLVVHCGPDVMAFTVGPHGTCLLGRWNYEEWEKNKTEPGS